MIYLTTSKSSKKADPPPVLPPVAIPQPQLIQTREVVTGGEHPSTEFLENYMDLTTPKLKYSILQSRNLLYAHLDPDICNQIIEVLEKSSWTTSDFTRLVYKTYFYQTRVGLFAFFTQIYERKLLESDSIEDLRYIRDNLKNVIPGLMRMTGETVSTFRKNVVAK